MEERKPKISIITVSFNSEKHIEEAIISVLNQSYNNVEYIIIDGGSSDNTLSIINKYSDRVAYFISEPDKGISDAFNKGIKASTGDIIGIVNSDDQLYDSRVLERVAEYYSPEIDIYRGSELIRNYETGYEYMVYPTMKLQKNPITFHVCHMAMFISRDAFNKYGMYDTEFKYSMDKELVCRFLYMGARSVKMDIVVGLFRLGGVSQSSDKRKRKESAMIVSRTGGNWFNVKIYEASLLTKEVIKKILGFISPDLARKIRYNMKRR